MKTILDTTADVNLFASWFKDRETWAAWESFLCALFALPMSDDRLKIYQDSTKRTRPPTSVAKEAWLVVGRRGGKSFVLALIAVYLACFTDYRRHLAKGERGTIMVIATDRRQARVILRYISGLLTVPLLASKVTRSTAQGYDLSNSVTIEVHTAGFRGVRGYTIVAALLDELAFWRGEESTDPDTEILAALRPGMATIPGSMLLCASSPYARRGALWETYRKYFAKDHDPVLVWQAATRVMNPTVPQSVIDQALDDDPAAGQAEYLAQFRTDIESYIAREVVEACVEPNCYERQPLGHRYVAFTDPSGGSSDSFTLAVAHKDREQLVLDCLREVRPPFSPEAVTLDFAQVCHSYHVSRVTGDRYAGQWPREQFGKHGIHYEVSEKVKSDLYRDLLPLLNSKRVELLDNSRLITQLVSLERRTSRAGRDSIDHGPSGHDDLANACAGALVLAIAAAQQPLRIGSYACGGGRITWNDLEPKRCRVRSVRVFESLAPAARGP